MPASAWGPESMKLRERRVRQGGLRCAVADYAARAFVPVVRFMPAGFGPEDFAVAQERPAALVFASEADARRFHYVEEAPRIVLPPARASSKNAPGVRAGPGRPGGGPGPAAARRPPPLPRCRYSPLRNSVHGSFPAGLQGCGGTTRRSLG